MPVHEPTSRDPVRKTMSKEDGSPDSTQIIKPEKSDSPDSVLSPLLKDTITDGDKVNTFEEEDDYDKVDKTWQYEYQVFRNYCGIRETSPYVQGTTLLKALPYNGIKDFYKDKDECECFEKQLEIIRAGKSDIDREDIKTISHLELTGCEPGNLFIETGPVLQIISVSIFNEDSSWKGSEIYGQIFLDHYKSQTRFFFYETMSDNSHAVSPDHTDLSLTHCPIAPVMKGKVQFHLFTSGGVQIFNNCFVLDYLLESDFEGQEDEIIVYGRRGYYAKMVYIIIPCAFVSDVLLALIGPPNSEVETIHVDGEITANNFDFLTEKELKIASKSNFCTIYHVPKSRLAIAIPIFSSLLVDFKVTMGGKEFAIGKLQSLPSESTREKQNFDIKDKKRYYFQLEVDWVSPNEYFRIFPEIRQPMSDHYVEVFSVALGGGSAPSLCGTIVVRDREETVYIFSRNKCRPDKQWSGRNRLSLAWPTDRWVVKNNFYMHLKLKDDKQCLVCRGGLYCSSNPSQFDRRVCAVIPGEDDYFAVVHYSVFVNGLRAQVTVTIKCKNCFDHLDVWGTVYARYNNYDYSSTYDKEYYQIVIFDRLEEFRAKVKNCSEIPLSKSLVTAPSDCRELSIDVRLTVRPFKDSMFRFDLSAIGVLQFSASINACQQLPIYLCGDDRRIGQRQRGMVTVKVDWFDLQFPSDWRV